MLINMCIVTERQASIRSNQEVNYHLLQELKITLLWRNFVRERQNLSSEWDFNFSQHSVI